MRIHPLFAVLTLSLSGALGASACVQRFDAPTDEGVRLGAAEEAATTPCEDACFVLYLAACARCAQLGLGRSCYAEAMEEYVRCAKRCRDEGQGGD
jgi:hypothetical protein